MSAWSGRADWRSRKLGILAALPDELAGLLAEMSSARVTRIGMRDYHEGRLHGRDCVLALARVGKTAAASTATTLIREFGVESVLFTGLAGALGHDVAMGDVVVADHLVHHDMDARPLFPRFEVPLLERAYFDADAAMREALADAAQAFFSSTFSTRIDAEARARFGLAQPTVHRGLIASGDLFVRDLEMVAGLRSVLPEVLCVEMEGAAVAQVCFEHAVPCAVIRVISDRADASAPVDFPAFLRHIAAPYAAGIMQQCLQADDPA